VKILIDFLKFWNFSYIIQLTTRCSAARVSVFDVIESSITTTRRSKHLCKSRSTFRKPWDCIFISHFSLFCSPRSFIIEFNTRIFILHKISASHWTQNDICVRSSHQSTRLRRVVIFIVIVIIRIISEKELFWTHKWVHYSVNQEMKIVKSSRHKLVSHVSRWFWRMNRTKLQDSNKRCTEITAQLFT
jgi:hypothetical protein